MYHNLKGLTQKDQNEMVALNSIEVMEELISIIEEVNKYANILLATEVFTEKKVLEEANKLIVALIKKKALPIKLSIFNEALSQIDSEDQVG